MGLTKIKTLAPPMPYDFHKTRIKLFMWRHLLAPVLPPMLHVRLPYIRSTNAGTTAVP